MIAEHETWEMTEFYRSIAAKTGIKPGACVIDLGAGRGLCTTHLRAEAGLSGAVVAVDYDREDLAFISSEAASNNPLAPCMSIVADFNFSLPFASNIFDVAICQDVLECVVNKSLFIEEVLRVLKPGGTLFISHHDFDGVVIASGDRSLTRQIVHGYADSIPNNQKISNGQMGRELYGILSNHKECHISSGTSFFVDTNLSADSYANFYLYVIENSLDTICVPHDHCLAWIVDQRDRAQRKEFYFGIPWMWVKATKVDS